MQKIRLFLVEDDAPYAKELLKELTNFGYEISGWAQTAEESITQAATIRPDVVLMDILLPGAMDGVSAAAEIQTRYSIPVIFLTAYADPATLERARMAGGTGYLIKPVDSLQVHASIQIALAERRTLSRTPESSADFRPKDILKKINDCVVATDQQGRICYMNRAAEKLTGWTAAEATGLSSADVLNVIPDSDRETFGSSLPGRPEYYLLIARNGTRTAIEQQTVVLGDLEGETAGFAVVFRDISEWRRAEKVLRESREKLKELVHSIDGIVWEADLKRNQFSFVSKQALRILGYPIRDWTTREQFWKHAVYGPDLARVIESERVELGRHKNYTLEYRMLTFDGRAVWIKDMVNVVLQNDIPVRLLGVMVEVTAQKEAEQRLFESEEEYRSLVESAPDVIYTLSALGGVITMLNPAFEKITGWKREKWVGKTFLSLLHPDDVGPAIDRYERLLSGESQPPVEFRFRSSSGDYLVGEITSKANLKHGKIEGIFGMVRDITERKHAEEQLVRNAFYDSLTGLPNRALFMDRLGHAMFRTRRKKSITFAVLFIDLDRFKVVNDSLGHMIGDELLVETAHRLKNALRPEDTVSRIGGDEFVILLDQIGNISEATLVAERIQQELQRPFQISGQDVYTSASIGIAFHSQTYHRPEEILRDADIAMYRAKSLGRSRYAIFDSEMHTRAMGLLQLETDLRRALEREELRLHYQPIVSLETYEIKAVEALVRWFHPQRGLILPNDFIPLAEETGLINVIGEFVILQACRQMRAWQEQFPDHESFRVSVNLSGRQFSNPNLVNQISRILAETKIDPARLTLEITETILMETGENAVRMLNQLRALNISFQIDDFGTGYSSLGYLRRFPISALKIDRSFIQAIHGEHGDAEIVRMIVALAKTLDLEVIAEGVETEEQLRQMQQLGCLYAQGHILAPPLDVVSVTEMIFKGADKVSFAPFKRAGKTGM